jgi:hypothetical protein
MGERYKDSFFESDLSWRNEMQSIDDFRFKSHHLLLELDAAVTELMMLVSIRETNAERWAMASQRHFAAYAEWSSFMYGSKLNLPSNTVS